MIEVEIEDDHWRVVQDVEAVVSRSVETALASPFASGGRAEIVRPDPRPGGLESVSLLLAGDDAVHALNARFRHRDAPTNVLSFPAPKTAYPHLGDVALAYEVCAREADEQGKSLPDHLSHLVVHGVLHLLGYDHEADADAEIMEALERDILARIGIADPYCQDRDHRAASGRTGADARP